MKCPQCNSTLPDDAFFCPSCGNRAGSGRGYYQQPGGLNELCVVGAVLGVVSLLLPLFGITGIISLACSIGGMLQTSKNSQRGSALGIIGIVLSVLSIIYVMYIFVQAFSVA